MVTTTIEMPTVRSGLEGDVDHYESTSVLLNRRSQGYCDLKRRGGLSAAGAGHKPLQLRHMFGLEFVDRRDFQ